MKGWEKKKCNEKFWPNPNRKVTLDWVGLGAVLPRTPFAFFGNAKAKNFVQQRYTTAPPPLCVRHWSTVTQFNYGVQNVQLHALIFIGNKGHHFTVAVNGRTCEGQLC